MTNREESKLIEFFRLLSIDFNCLVKTKEGRSKIQDIIYLAQSKGIDLGYREWVWYPFNRGA